MSKKQDREKQEEMVRTQVLNLDELRQVARFEKKTSKKPAAFCAIIGAFMIAVGIGGQGYITMEMNKIKKIQNQPNIVHKKADKIEHNESSLQCIKANNQNADGTKTQSTFIFKFQDNKLVGESKTFLLDAIEGNEVGIATAKNLFVGYKGFEPINGTVNGYTVNVLGRSETGFTVTTEIDLNKVDATMITPAHQANEQTRIDFPKDSTLEDVNRVATSSGYICSQNK